MCKWALADLVPDHVGQGADELRGRVAVALEGFLVDHLADGEPEGCLEALPETQPLATLQSNAIQKIIS
jgi:hypothetical protein